MVRPKKIANSRVFRAVTAERVSGSQGHLALPLQRAVENQSLSVFGKMELATMSDKAVQMLKNFYVAVKPWLNSESAIPDLPLDMAYSIADALKYTEPFSYFNGTFVLEPNGYRRFNFDGTFGEWVFDQFKRDRSAEEIVESVQRMYDQNACEFWIIRPARGVRVDNVVRIDDDTFLTPNGMLYQDHYWRLSFVRTDEIGSTAVTSTAALVQVVRVSPAFLKEQPKNIKERFDNNKGKILERMKRAELIRLALGLATGGTVQFPITYEGGPPDTLLAESLGGEFSPAQGTWDELLLDVPKGLEFIHLLDGMMNSASLLLYIDRLLSSRHQTSTANKLIDLGMAVEIALMHEESGHGDGKGEISNKIAMRGGWLIGNDAASRSLAGKSLSELYAARSIVVHTGMVPHKFESRVAEFDRLASTVIEKLLRRGKFPDWRLLAFGG